jgi:hypothetical protein
MTCTGKERFASAPGGAIAETPAVAGTNSLKFGFTGNAILL